jgi:hypothetical protein
MTDISHVQESDDGGNDIVNLGDKIEIQEMQYLQLLPDINMRFLQNNNKLTDSQDSLPEDFEESKKKRIEILKRVLNRKIMADPSAS